VSAVSPTACYIIYLFVMLLYYPPLQKHLPAGVQGLNNWLVVIFILFWILTILSAS